MSKDSNILFDFLNDINHGKRNILTEENKKQYSAFMINRFLSAHMETVYQANEMNQRYWLDTRMQYDFLLHSIRKAKRFCKYLKSEKLEDIDLISRYYDVSKQKAKEMLSLHTSEDLEQIREFFNEGGWIKKPRARKAAK